MIRSFQGGRGATRAASAEKCDCGCSHVAKKKQQDICVFVDNFCREAKVDSLNEELHWYYCKETNTKLFPASITAL